MTLSTDDSPPGVREQRATRIALFVAGFGIAAWAPLVPLVKMRAGLDERSLGLLLLCLGLSSILAMPLSGAWARRAGCRTVVLSAVATFALMLPVLATASSPWLLAAALAVFGVGNGSVDCVANIQAVIVERASGRTLMSGFHAFYSIGGLIGAAASASLLALGIPPLAVAASASAVILLLAAISAPGLLPYGGAGEGAAFAPPRGVVILIAAFCFVVFLAEGAALDWSAVFLVEVRGVDPDFGGFGFTAFSLAMSVGRLTGDGVVDRLGGGRVLVFGGLLAAAGLGLATLVPAWPMALAGYALLGLGCSNLVPVLFSALGLQTDMAEHTAVPAVTTIGYAGILAGPAAIGVIAQATSLPTAFLTVAALLLAIAFASRLLKA